MTSLSALQGDAQVGAGPGDRPIPAVLGDRAMRTFSEHPALHA
jgi:hypothetical protein